MPARRAVTASVTVTLLPSQCKSITGKRALDSAVTASVTVTPTARSIHLDVVRVAERQHRDAERLQRLDLAMRDALRIERADGGLQIGHARHAQAQVIQADAVLGELVGWDGLGRVGRRVEG